MLKKIAFSFVLICIQFVTHAQNLIYSYTFNNDMDSWTSSAIQNSGFWTWSPNGKADDGIFWDSREPINGTLGGSLVYDGDFIINSNQGDSTVIYETAVMSPKLNFKEQDKVFIKFNQYYRNYDSHTALEISINQGQSWEEIELNSGINRNIETSNLDRKIIDISEIVANESDVLVRFVFEGRYYFWLLDDIEFYDAKPVLPTIPAYIGEFLTANNYPYEVDGMGWPYIPNEAVLDFATGTSEADKAAIREELGAIVKETCVCNLIETWTFVDDLLEGGIGLSSTGGSTGTDEHVQTSESASEVDEVDFNKYNYNELLNGQYVPANMEEVVHSLKQSDNKEIIKVAILDTGVDLLHKDLANSLYLSNDVPFDSEDNDKNCMIDDVVGWNFVNDSNNTSDDHGHGSHVAGIVARYANKNNERDLVSIIPYKTHDSNGLANLFDVTCAMYQSMVDKVSVVNCSWGFYGNESGLLEKAIQKAKENKITVIAASGNDATYLNDNQQFPACYHMKNLISVGSYDLEHRNEQVINAVFSNYGENFVDILAPGVDIYSTVPNNSYQFKTGTSMAAPVIAGVAATKYIEGFSNPYQIRQSILEEALKLQHLEFEVLDGNVFRYGLENDATSILSLFENNAPVSMKNSRSHENNTNSIRTLNNNELTIEFNKTELSVRITIFDVSGRVFSRKVLNETRKGVIQSIDLTSLLPGVYFIRVNKETKKFIII